MYMPFSGVGMRQQEVQRGPRHRHMNHIYLVSRETDMDMKPNFSSLWLLTLLAPARAHCYLSIRAAEIVTADKVRRNRKSTRGNMIVEIPEGISAILMTLESGHGQLKFSNSTGSIKRHAFRHHFQKPTCRLLR
jgi:hypothetical protein